MDQIQEIEDMKYGYVKVLLNPGCKIQIITPVLQEEENPHNIRFTVTFSEPKSILYTPEARPFFEMKENTLQIDSTKDCFGNTFEKDPYGFFISIPPRYCLTFDYVEEKS